MMKKLFTKNVQIGVIIVLLSAGATPLRISSIIVNLSEPTRVFLSPGLACQIRFPEEVGDVSQGSPEADLLVLRSPAEPKRLTLILKSPKARPSNVIVTSGGKTFVFDVIPSPKGKFVHQDLVEISGSFGGPRVQTSGALAEGTSRGGS